jgi:2-methylcitrate dehydratase PrpD
MSVNETRRLAQWLAQLSFDDLPEVVVDYTKRVLLDDVGCMLGGALQLGNKALVRTVLAQRELGDSTIAVYGHRTSAPNAALLNGTFICGWDYDNMTVSGGHMGSQTAAVLAIAEQEHVDGKAILTAECAGIEAQARIGLTTGVVGEVATHPWHSNTTLGPFAAAVATGKILGFDAEQMAHTIAIATHNMGGNYQHYYGWGSNIKRIRCGIGAWSGIRAALLAQAGIAGPAEALESERGYLPAMHGRGPDEPPFYDSSAMTARLGEQWHILTYNTKGFGVPCVTGLQIPCITALASKAKYNIYYKDIASVMVEHCVDDGIVQAESIRGTHLGRTPEQRLGSAGWSRRWMVALCLVLGVGGIREQLENVRPYGRYRDIEALSEKIDGRINEAYYFEHFQDRPYPNTYGGRVIITLDDGTVYDHEPVPYLGCHMSDGTISTVTVQQLIEKLKEQAPLAGISTVQQDQIVDIIIHMDKQDDISGLMKNVVRCQSAR